MVLLVTSAVLGSAAFAVGVILQLSLPLWQFFSGIGSFSPVRRENVVIPKLRRRLSMLFYGVGGVFLSGAILLAVKTVTPEFLFMVYPLILLAALDAFWILYRIYDKNPYPPHITNTALVFIVLLNVAIGVWYAIIVV